VPGAVIRADELQQFAVSTDKEVARYLDTLDALEVRVLVPVELVGKQALHRIAIILARRQTNAMQHNQIDFNAVRARSEIW
jgi:hypothetical protein